MKNFKIRTTLALGPRCDCGSKFIYITRGETAILQIDTLSTKADFKQLTVTFVQPNGAYESYSYYDSDGNVDSHFKYDEVFQAVLLTLSQEETAAWQDTCEEQPLLWEVMEKSTGDYVDIRKQTPIVVHNSLYNKTHYYAGAVIVSSTLVCSPSLACNE